MTILLEVSRDLQANDLLRLGSTPHGSAEGTSSVPVLQKLRAIHHRQAQLLAAGRKPTEVAAIVGCTVQRLVQLQVDPAFQQLVGYYQDQIMVATLNDETRLREKIITVGETAVDELAERLEDEASRKKIHISEIRKIAEFAMDRTVAPPKVAQPATAAPANVTINFGTPIRPQASDAKFIEGEAEPNDTPGSET